MAVNLSMPLHESSNDHVSFDFERTEAIKGSDEEEKQGDQNQMVEKLSDQHLRQSRQSLEPIFAVANKSNVVSNQRYSSQ